MNFTSYTNTDAKIEPMSFIYKSMPRYLASKHRVHKMFFRKCSEQITPYETCIENPKWKANIDQYITASMRRKCYDEWVQVRRCAIRNLGDTFAVKLNMSRQLEPDHSEEEHVMNLEYLIDNKASTLKIEKNQFGPPEEEEGGEAEAESEEESEENSESSSDAPETSEAPQVEAEAESE